MGQKFLIKYTAITIGIVLLLVIVIIAIKRLKDRLSEFTRSSALASELSNEIKTSSLTLTAAQFNAYASSLYSAMKGMGTDEEKIYSVFRAMGTRDDVLQLIKVFGVKDNMTLAEWLNDDLSASEIGKINLILAGNNINYAF